MSIVDLTSDEYRQFHVVPISRFFIVLTKEQKELQLTLNSQRRHTENIQKQLENSFEVTYQFHQLLKCKLRNEYLTVVPQSERNRVG